MIITRKKEEGLKKQKERQRLPLHLRHKEQNDNSKYSHLSSLGYDKEQLKDMMGMTQNRDDFRLAEYLMAGNEKDVFTIAPENFSDGGKNILAAYAINVGIKDIDSGNGLQNLQNFTNHMLSAENWKEKEYMEIMSVYCGLQREAVATAMWKSEGLDMTLVDKMEKVNAITGFYQSLYITGYDMQLDYATLTYQKLHICVEDLSWDEGAVRYSIAGYTQMPIVDPLESKVVSRTHWSPLQANSDLFTSEMNKINEQIQTLWQSCAVDLVIKSTELVDGNCAKLLTLSKAIYEDNIKSGVSAVSGLKAGEKKFGKGTVYAADVFGIAADYYQKKEKLEANYEQAGVNSMVSWFYSSNAYTENGSMDIYNTGIYNGYTIEAIKEWNREGIASLGVKVDIDTKLGNKFFIKHDTYIELNKDKWERYKDLKKYTDEEITNAMLLILYGKKGMESNNKTYISSMNSVNDIEPELFSICITEINDVIAQNQEDNALEDWWDEKRKSYKENK